MKNANDKIDSAAKAVKLKAENVIDDIAEAAVHVAAKAGRHVHDAGVKVKDAGQKVKDAGEKLKKMAD
jgi:hypothetical protein